MAYTLSNTAAQIDTGVARAYARIGDTGVGGSLTINFGSDNLSSGEAVAIGFQNESSHAYSTSLGVLNSAHLTNSTAVGNQNTASGVQATAIGASNDVVGSFGSAIGVSNAAYQYASALGYNNRASGVASSAIGYSTIASGINSSAIGSKVKTTVNYSHEFGDWDIFGPRKSAVRVHGSGYVVISTPIGNTGYSDGGAVEGSEPDGTLFRGGLSFKLRSDNGQLWAFYNSGGSIKSGQVASLV